MKKIVQYLILSLLLTCVASSFAEEIKITAIASNSAGGIPKTGDITQRYVGDDGYYQMGNPVTPRFIDNGNGTVTDNATGLMWEQKTNDGTIHMYTDTYTWIYAFDVFLNGTVGTPVGNTKIGLNKMNAGAGFAGYNDWRIPNIFELQSIVDFNYISPNVYLIFRTSPYSSSTPYWSSTTHYYNPAYAYCSYGHVTSRFKTGTAYLAYVRAVRGGQR
jgi:hypothetical protein